MIPPTAALRHRSSAKFSGPNNQRTFEHPALFEIAHQRHASSVDFLRLDGDPVLDPTVMIPISMVKLNEAHPTLCQTPCEQTICGEGAIARHTPVKFKSLRPFRAHIHEIRHTRLHLKGHLILGYTSGNFRIIHQGRMIPVERVNGIHVAPLLFHTHPGRAPQIKDGIPFGA